MAFIYSTAKRDNSLPTIVSSYLFSAFFNDETKARILLNLTLGTFGSERLISVRLLRHFKDS